MSYNNNDTHDTLGYALLPASYWGSTHTPTWYAAVATPKLVRATRSAVQAGGGPGMDTKPGFLASTAAGEDAAFCTVTASRESVPDSRLRLLLDLLDG